MNKRSLIIQNIGTIIFFLALNVFMIFMFLYAFEVLPASAAEALPSSNGGNYVISGDGDLVQFNNGTIFIFGDKVRPSTIFGVLVPTQYMYYKLINGSMVPFSVFDTGFEYSFIVSGRYKLSFQSDTLIHVSDAYLTDASLTRNITLIPTSNYALYVRYNDTVCMLESTSPFNINYVDGLNYIVSNTGVTRYEWHDGWQQASSSASAYTTNFIYRVIGDFYTRSDFSIFAFAFKGELASGEVPEFTPTPTPTPYIPNETIENYYDFISKYQGYDIFINYDTDFYQNGVWLPDAYIDCHFAPRGTVTIDGRNVSGIYRTYYKFNMHTLELVSVGNAYASISMFDYFQFYYSFGLPQPSNKGVPFDSFDLTDWPFLPSVVVPEVSSTPSPIPTFVPTVTPEPTVVPAVSITPDAFLSPFPTGLLVTAPPWADDIHDVFNTVDLDAGSSWGLWGYAFSFIPSQLRNLVWVFVAGLLIVAFFWLIGG